MNLHRPRAPELEHELARNPQLGYEPQGSFGSVRCLEHGFPNQLVRWHYHEEYELHLIVATRGKVFVGETELAGAMVRFVLEIVEQRN